MTVLSEKKKLYRITDQGLKDLGNLIRKVRGDKSMQDFTFEIYLKTGEKISTGSISHLERGNVEPKFSTLAILTASVLTDYTIPQLFAIACEEDELK
jgi:hypothetical protein